MRQAPVSIISANFNNAPFLEDFIESIMQSTLLPMELIIVDDGSTDHSPEILRRYSHLQWIICILLPKNHGLTYALNAGLNRATAKYIMRADPDDIFLPHRIEKQVSFLEGHPEIDVVGSNVTYFRGPGVTHLNQSNFPTGHKAISRRIKRGEHGIQHPTAMVRSALFKDHPYQPLFPGEDYELFARMLKNGARFANIPESLYLMRIHTGSSTSNLKMEHIRRTFAFRDALFHTNTPKWWVWVYFHHIRLYRAYQLSPQPIIRHLYLFLSLLLYPVKLMDRLFQDNRTSYNTTEV